MNQHMKVEAAQPIQAAPSVRAAMSAQNKRKRWTYISAFLFVFIPSLLAGIYYFAIAADQYSVQVRIAVRGPEGASPMDLMSQVTGASVASSTITDAYILMDYLQSRQLLEELQARGVNFDEIFNAPEADFLAAFPAKNRSIERLVEYWKGMVHFDFDTTSKIIILQVRSFTPEHSKQLAHETLKLSEALITRLSERSRNDALRVANLEVTRQENRMRKTAALLRAFREKNQDVDPTQSTAALVGRLSAIESQLNDELAKLTTNLIYMKENSPVIQFSRSKISALRKQVAVERAKLGQGTGAGASSIGTISRKFEEYQALKTEEEFAGKAYLLAQQSLETARVTANQQQRYLATFVLPSLPQEALYPQRWINTGIAFVLSFCLWFIGLMIVYGIRDHAR